MQLWTRRFGPAANLDSLYLWFNERLVQANVKKDAEPSASATA